MQAASYQKGNWKRIVPRCSSGLLPERTQPQRRTCFYAFHVQASLTSVFLFFGIFFSCTE